MKLNTPKIMSSDLRILVIKLGALGDFVLSLGPCAAIRRYHPEAHITLLTIDPFLEFAGATNYFDEIWIDRRVPWWRPDGWLALRRRLRRGKFDRVYDLQTSDRSGWYFHLLRKDTEWSGIVSGCSHPHANPNRDGLHTQERQAEQLAICGIKSVPRDDLSWATAEIEQFNILAPAVIIAPGGSLHRHSKRWPVSQYVLLVQALAEMGYQPVLIGTSSEHEITQLIAASCDSAKDLTGLTTLLDLVALTRIADLAIGNDTGPMHIAAAAGCHSIVLFSSDSDPALTAPRGDRVTVLKQNNLADLSVEDVLAAFSSC